LEASGDRPADHRGHWPVRPVREARKTYASLKPATKC
jgi:hypothetical protein